MAKKTKPRAQKATKSRIHKSGNRNPKAMPTKGTPNDLSHEQRMTP